MMTKSYKNSLNKIAVFMMSAVFSASAFSLTELTDDELAEVIGQASLIDIDKYDFDGGDGVNNFYRVRLNSVITTSLNADRLDLKDSDGNSQILIEDLSLSGGVDGEASSATITNPYVEFAFAGSIDNTTARNREIIGIRVGADEIDGLLSFGDPTKHASNLAGDTSQENGISAFRGFLQTTAINGNVILNPATRTGIVQRTNGDPTRLRFCNIVFGCGGFFGGESSLSPVGVQTTSTGTFELLDRSITGPDQRIMLDFSVPGGVVIDSSLGSLANPLPSGGNVDENGVITSAFLRADVAATTIGQITGTSVVEAEALGIGLPTLTPQLVINDIFVSGDLPGTTDPLKLFLREDLRFLHRVDANGSGGFVSVQNRPVQWRIDNPSGGRTTSNTTPGWWVEFIDPVELSQLTVENFDLPQNVVQGIVGAVGDFIFDRPPVPVSELVTSLFEIEVGGIDASLARTEDPGVLGASLVNVLATNISIDNQVPIVNCFNSSIGC